MSYAFVTSSQTVLLVLMQSSNSRVPQPGTKPFMMFPFTAMETERRQTSLNSTFISFWCETLILMCCSPPLLSVKLSARLSPSQPWRRFKPQTNRATCTYSPFLSPTFCLCPVANEWAHAERHHWDPGSDQEQFEHGKTAETADPGPAAPWQQRGGASSAGAD